MVPRPAALRLRPPPLQQSEFVRPLVVQEAAEGGRSPDVVVTAVGVGLSTQPADVCSRELLTAVLGSVTTLRPLHETLPDVAVNDAVAHQRTCRCLELAYTTAFDRSGNG